MQLRQLPCASQLRVRGMVRMYPGQIWRFPLAIPSSAVWPSVLRSGRHLCHGSCKRGIYTSHGWPRSGGNRSWVQHGQIWHERVCWGYWKDPKRWRWGQWRKLLCAVYANTTHTISQWPQYAMKEVRKLLITVWGGNYRLPGVCHWLRTNWFGRNITVIRSGS